MILLATSASKVTVSVLALPNVILPSAVILPVACKSPVTRTLLFKLITPEPLAVILIAPLVLVALIVFPVKLRLPMSAVP